jgi:acetyl-CoA synthetase
MSDYARFLAARDLLLKHRANYDAARREFRWPELERFNWALDHFDSLASRTPDAMALVVRRDDGRETRTFEELSTRSSQVAAFLRRAGVRRRDRVLVMLPNSAALWETMLACMKLGAIIVPATLQLTKTDLEDRVLRGGVRIAVVDASVAEKVETVAGFDVRVVTGEKRAGFLSYGDAAQASTDFAMEGRTAAADPMLLYFTSGTTAKPKLVMHTHTSYPVGHLSTMYWIGLQPGDVHLNISSPGWAKHAWSNVFAPWNAGATVVALDYTRFNARAVLDALVEESVTTLCAPPTVFRMMILEDLAAWKVGLREIVAAGEPLNPEIIQRVRAAWNLDVRDGFGQTETTAVVGNSPGQPLKPGSMGRPLPGYDVVLLDGEGQPDEEGEITLSLSPRPTGLMVGYEDDPVLTTQVMRGGHYHTGDVGSRDAAGYVTYVGRADDVFKASDYRISPFELESVLLEHPAVAEAAVVPSPDELRAAVPKAYVALAPGFEPGAALAHEILQFVKERVAPYKRIKRLEFRELPKTISGKIRRVELRRLEAERAREGTGGDFEAGA